MMNFYLKIALDRKNMQLLNKTYVVNGTECDENQQSNDDNRSKYTFMVDKRQLSP